MEKNLPALIEYSHIYLCAAGAGLFGENYTTNMESLLLKNLYGNQGLIQKPLF